MKVMNEIGRDPPKEKSDEDKDEDDDEDEDGFNNQPTKYICISQTTQRV